MSEEKPFKKSVEELRLLKKTYEQNLSLILNDFESETGLLAKDLHVVRNYYYGGSKQGSLETVQINVNL